MAAHVRHLLHGHTSWWLRCSQAQLAPSMHRHQPSFKARFEQALELEAAAVSDPTLTPAAVAEAKVVARMRQERRSFVPESAQLDSCDLQVSSLGLEVWVQASGASCLSWTQLYRRAWQFSPYWLRRCCQHRCCHNRRAASLWLACLHRRSCVRGAGWPEYHHLHVRPAAHPGLPVLHPLGLQVIMLWHLWHISHSELPCNLSGPGRERGSPASSSRHA